MNCITKLKWASWYNQHQLISRTNRNNIHKEQYKIQPNKEKRKIFLRVHKLWKKLASKNIWIKQITRNLSLLNWTEISWFFSQSLQTHKFSLDKKIKFQIPKDSPGISEKLAPSWKPFNFSGLSTKISRWGSNKNLKYL